LHAKWTVVRLIPIAWCCRCHCLRFFGHMLTQSMAAPQKLAKLPKNKTPISSLAETQLCCALMRLNCKVRVSALLLAPRMGFGAFGKKIVRPDFLVHRQLRSALRCRDRGGLIFRGHVPIPW